MKKSVILLVAMLVVSFASAQKFSDKKIPAVVSSALQKNYPNAKELKWEKEKGNYEAEFEVDETDYSLLIDDSGNILETEVEIEVDALPLKAKEYVSINYAGHNIKDSEMITNRQWSNYLRSRCKGQGPDF